ncbi:hypothetical protein ACKWTF_009601 [Chironomus riparius]
MCMDATSYENIHFYKYKCVQYLGLITSHFDQLLHYKGDENVSFTESFVKCSTAIRNDMCAGKNNKKSFENTGFRAQLLVRIFYFLYFHLFCFFYVESSTFTFML